MSRHWWLVSLLLGTLAVPSIALLAVDVNCDPCINREETRVKVIVHGTKNDGFWHQIRKAAMQTGNDLRVDLDFELYETFSEEQMAQDIANEAALAAANEPTAAKALLVTIPSSRVEEAVRKAINVIPVFGLNSGYTKAGELGMLSFVAMDEYLGGSYAAKEILSQSDTVQRVLYVNHAKGNTALEARRTGLVDTLVQNSVANGTISEVDELAVDTSSEALRTDLEAALDGCSYDAVLLAGLVTYADLKAAMESQGCDTSRTVVGVFDTDRSAFNDIAVGKLAFAISQQQYLQGSLSVALASLYATTGKTIARSSESEFGIYFSGPKVINIRNLPSDTLQACEAEAFPVCGGTATVHDGTFGICPCIDRSKIKIGGVLHGVTTDGFWDVVFEQAKQAADDLGVDLRLDRLEPQPSVEVWHTKMARKMVSLCQEGVNGLFISIPSEIVATAIRECQALNVPVISVNSGVDLAQELGLIHHISQLEYAAGFAAGERLAASGINEGICVNTEVGNEAIERRCQGFSDAIQAQNITYIGTAQTALDSDAVSIRMIQETVARDDDWSGLGMLTTGQDLHETIRKVKDLHPNFVAGAFDLSEAVFAGLDDNTILFAIDQNPFVQGYMPVWLLTILAYSRQQLANRFIESGPTFIERSPSQALQQCTENNFEVCDRPKDIIYEDNLLDQGILIFGYISVAISWTLSILFLCWILKNRRLSSVQASQPGFLILICVGAFVSSSTLVALSFQAGTGEDTNRASNACTVAPFLYTIGWVLIFGSLCGKTFRMFKIMKNCTEEKQEVVSFYSMVKIVIFALAVDMALVVAWTLLNPLEYKREELSRDIDDVTGTITVNSIGYCSVRDDGRPGFWAFAGPLIGFHLILMTVTNFLLYKVSDMKDRYQESKYMGFAMLLMLETLVVGAPIAVAVGDAQALHVVLIGIIAVHDIGVLSLLFIPKILFQSSAKDDALYHKEDSVILASLKKVSTSKFGEAMEILDEVSKPDSRTGLSERQRSQLRLVKTLLIQRNSRDNRAHVPSQLYINRSSNVYILKEFGGVYEAEKDANSISMSTTSGMQTKSLAASTASLNHSNTPFYILPEFQELPTEEQRRTVFRLLSWSNLKAWDFPIFDVAKVTNFQPLLFVGWAILGSPYSQYAMAKACGYNDVQLEDFRGYSFADSRLKIPIKKLCDYIRAVESDYNNANPYHNATHATDVLQTLHSLIQMQADRLTNTEDLFAILLSAVVHDVKHPGKNNSFQINAKTNVALVYNDVSVLENKHAAHAFMLMFKNDAEESEAFTEEDWEIPDLNLLSNVDRGTFVSIRKKVIDAVLHTDMSKHFVTVDAMRGLLEEHGHNLSGDNSWSLLTYMLHVADISNPAKGDPLFKFWTDRCLEEFFAQGDMETEMGLPLSPNCDRKTTDKAKSQIGFINFVVKPAFEVLALVAPEIRERILPQIERNLAYWSSASD